MDNQRADRAMADLRLEAPLRAGGPNPVPIEELLRFHRCSGASAAVIDGGEVVWERGFGTIELGSDVAVTPATCFQCCSISKHVAMVGALRLVDQGRLALDANVNDYLRAWRLPNGPGDGATVTARMLLGHTAGLTYCWYRGFGRGEPLPTRLEVLEGRPPANTPPVRVVRDQATFRYSGSHYTVLEQLLVDLTGEPFPELMRRLVLDPLGMANSSYDQAFPETRPELAARGHYDDGVVVRGGWRVQPERAAAGLWTTAGDLARLAVELQRAHAGRSRLLSKGAVDQALAPGPDENWGLGATLAGEGTDRRFGHGGDNVGFKARTSAYLERGQGAVALVNGDDGTRVIDVVCEAIGREYGWPATAKGGSIGRLAWSSLAYAPRCPMSDSPAGAASTLPVLVIVSGGQPQFGRDHASEGRLAGGRCLVARDEIKEVLLDTLGAPDRAAPRCDRVCAADGGRGGRLAQRVGAHRRTTAGRAAGSTAASGARAESPVHLRARPRRAAPGPDYGIFEQQPGRAARPAAVTAMATLILFYRSTRERRRREGRPFALSPMPGSGRPDEAVPWATSS